MAKMIDINLSEVSVVDYPAHMVHGFAVIKSADPDTNRALKSALRKETMPEKELAEVLKGLSAEEIRKALTGEQLAELIPVAEIEVVKAVETEEDILKSLPENVREMIEKSHKALADATAQIEKAEATSAIEKAARLDGEAIAKSEKDYTNLGFEHATVAPALRKFAEMDADAADAITKMLVAVNAQADGAIFKELGTDQDVSKDATPADKLNEIAKSVAASTNVPFSKAYELTVNDPANAAIVAAHFKENN